MRIGEHIGILPLTKKKVKPKEHLLLCYHSPSFENFSVLTKENKFIGIERKSPNNERYTFFKQKH